MDTLVMGNFVLEKKFSGASPEETANSFAKRAE
jgi:hypothetical protein